MITEQMKAGLQGVIPSPISTVSEDGNPNISYISQVYYVDDHHVAISNQFFNKTMVNIHSVGAATVNITDPATFHTWNLRLEYVRSENEGPLFDMMKEQLEVIASMSGMEDVFVLNASEVFKIVEVIPQYGSN